MLLILDKFVAEILARPLSPRTGAPQKLLPPSKRHSDFTPASFHAVPDRVSIPPPPKMSSHINLSAAADDRRAHLAKLRSLKRKQPDDEVLEPEVGRQLPQQEKQEPDITNLHLSGRNYDPETRGPKLGFEQDPTANLEKPTLEEQAAEVEEEIKRTAAEEAQDDKGIDLFKLQPKKPNWDLKRDLDAKMEMLNVRTDNAIAKLIRERIANAQETKQGDGGEAAGIDGVSLVEGVRLREKEEEEEARRERDDDD